MPAVASPSSSLGGTRPDLARSVSQDSPVLWCGWHCAPQRLHCSVITRPGSFSRALYTVITQLAARGARSKQLSAAQLDGGHSPFIASVRWSRLDDREETKRQVRPFSVHCLSTTVSAGARRRLFAGRCFHCCKDAFALGCSKSTRCTVLLRRLTRTCPVLPNLPSPLSRDSNVTRHQHRHRQFSPLPPPSSPSEPSRIQIVVPTALLYILLELCSPVSPTRGGRHSSGLPLFKPISRSLLSFLSYFPFLLFVVSSSGLRFLYLPCPMDLPLCEL